jgi:ABC-type nitrate/sulfonate/bicarbonate transport system ATPase subunit
VIDQDELIVPDASLRLREGESSLLRGMSGSDKSSLLNIIAGVSQPATGVVRVDRANAAYVPQEIALFGDTIWHQPALSGSRERPMRR